MKNYTVQKLSMLNKIAVLIAVPVIYFFIVSGFNPPEAGTGTTTSPPSIIYDSKDFTNCIFTPEYCYIKGTTELYPWNNLDEFEALHFNAINWYDFKGEEDFGVPGALLNTTQISNFLWVMDQVAAADPPIKGFYEKCNFSVPMYGQRLVYEVQPDIDNSDINYGFVYQSCMQNVYTTDQGRTVLHPRPGINQAGYLCKDIYENFQHTDLFDFRQNDKGTWYIKPVMKIPTGMDDSIPVVTIEIVSFDNTVLRIDTIKAGNFKDQNGNYYGEYRDVYTGLPPSNNLTILGDDATGHLNQGRVDDFMNWGNPSSSACCHVDFRVKWEGQVEVWFDKMVMDDEIANQVFAPAPNNWDQYIEQQAEEFTNYGSYYTFFTDETCISQIPCIKYVMKRMREAPNLPPGDPPKFSIAVTNYMHVRGLKNDRLSYKYFFDSLDVERVQMDTHPFYTYVDGAYVGSPIPDVFPQHDSRIPSNWFIETDDYNWWLQSAFGDKSEGTGISSGGSFIYQVNKIREDFFVPAESL